MNSFTNINMHGYLFENIIVLHENYLHNDARWLAFVQSKISWTTNTYSLDRLIIAENGDIFRVGNWLNLYTIVPLYISNKENLTKNIYTIIKFISVVIKDIAKDVDIANLVMFKVLVYLPFDTPHTNHLRLVRAFIQKTILGATIPSATEYIFNFSFDSLFTLLEQS